jgi:hypothetical protein
LRLGLVSEERATAQDVRQQKMQITILEYATTAGFEDEKDFSMIKETFIALKAIGVSDQHILNLIEALEARHDEYRRDIHDIKRDAAVLKWATTALFALMLLVLGGLVSVIFRLPVPGVTR